MNKFFYVLKYNRDAIHVTWSSFIIIIHTSNVWILNTWCVFYLSVLQFIFYYQKNLSSSSSSILTQVKNKIFRLSNTTILNFFSIVLYKYTYIILNNVLFIISYRDIAYISSCNSSCPFPCSILVNRFFFFKRVI